MHQRACNSKYPILFWHESSDHPHFPSLPILQAYMIYLGAFSKTNLSSKNRGKAVKYRRLGKLITLWSMFQTWPQSSDPKACSSTSRSLCVPRCCQPGQERVPWVGVRVGIGSGEVLGIHNRRKCLFSLSSLCLLKKRKEAHTSLWSPVGLFSLWEQSSWLFLECWSYHLLSLDLMPALHLE